MSIARVFASGNAHDIDYILKHLSPVGIQVEKDNTGYLVLSHEGGEEQLQELREVVTLINGLSCLELDSRTPLRINHCEVVSDEGVRLFIVEATEEFHVREFIEIEVKEGESSSCISLPGDRLDGGFELAMRDDAVKNVFRLLADADFSWVNLYRVYEIVRADLGGEKELVSKGWANKKTLSLFTHTANSFSAIGGEARHAAEQNDPPPHPMTHGAAKALVTLLVHEWLNEKS
jgi:hypothetical protein